MTQAVPIPDIARFPVEAGHIAIFARAIGDENPIYRDAAYAAARPCGGLIAPPTFVEAGIHFDPAFPFRPRPGEAWLGSGRDPTGIAASAEEAGSGMHAETHFTYHRTLRPGMVLRTSARPTTTWSRTGRAGGELTFHEVEVVYEDEQGLPVTSARNIYVFTSRKVNGGAAQDDPETVERQLAQADRARNLARPRYPVGQASGNDVHVAMLADNLSRAQIIQYAGASGDFSPQHVDEIYNTRVAGYPTVFAHGMLSMAMAGRLLTDHLGDDRLRTFGFRFKRQVWPGDDIFGRLEKGTPTDDGNSYAVTLFNGDGQSIGTGYATTPP